MAGTSADWDFDNLESLIQNRGEDVIHELGVSCTCRSEDAYASMLVHQGRHASKRKLGCSQCNGLGWFYRGARVIKGLVTSIESGRNRQLIESGYSVPGDAVFSPSMQAGQISDFDRITTLSAAPVSGGQVLMRNSANLDDNAYLSLGLAATEDRLWYHAECVLWCEDENGVVYAQDIDFEVADKVIRWGSRRPADGVMYAVKYNAFLEWIVYSTPMTRVDRDRTLGQRVLLRKLHVAALNNFEFDTVAKRVQQEKDFTSGVL